MSEIKKSRSWFFTWNNPDETAAQLAQLLHLLDPKAFVYQREKGEEGTEHYQGCVYLKNQCVMPCHLNPKIHWERCKSWVKAIKYCSKEDTRIEGPWTYNVALPQKLDIITQLKPWQNWVKEQILLKPNDRKILWLWEEAGNTGKTAMARYICQHFEAIYLNGKGSDAKYAVATMVGKGKPLDVVVFGYPRSAAEYVSYGCIEEIKDGIFFNSKYESGMVMYNSPHVIVFSNMEPDYTKMSQDRWDVQHIGCLERQLAIPVGTSLMMGAHPIFQPVSLRNEYEDFMAALEDMKDTEEADWGL